MFLVEILQPLVLRHLLLQRGIELAVLNGNAEIAAQSFSSSMSSLERKSPFVVLPRPNTAMVFCWAWQGM